MLEVFNNLFMNIADQMGATLQNTAYSVNIKERLDFSCALFDADGRPRGQRPACAGASGLHVRSHRTVARLNKGRSARAMPSC
jgi:5-oxoprolinase (ATP-hydrolysing)